MKTKTSLRKRIFMILTAAMTLLCLTVSVSATSDTGTMSSAISEVQTALTGVIGYLNGVTSALLGNDLWLLGMGFFVLMFIAGFVMYLFRVGRR